jgi:gliding motility-associated-like protein
MTLDNGLGGVTVKNVNLYSPSTEKITVAKHSNDSSWWLITKEKNGGKFITYLITGAGIDLANPVISDGADNPNMLNAVTGMLHASPDNSKVALASEFLNLVELFEFDNATGRLSNKVTINKQGPYGVEFSPNSRFLYVTAYGIGKLWQYDLNTYSQQDVNESEVLIKDYSLNGEHPFGLQLGPDNKLYISKNWTVLDAILEPDSKGDSCKFTPNYVDLKGRTANLMLTNVVPSLVTVTTTINVKYLDFCKRIVKFDCVNNFSENTKFSWYFEDVDSSNIKNPEFTFPFDKDSFNVKLITNTSIKDKNGNAKIVTLENYAKVAFETPPVAKFGDNNACGNKNISFKDSSVNRTGGVTSWYWSYGNGDTSKLQNPTYQYQKFGTYPLKMVAFSKSGCASDTVYKTLVVADKPIADFEQIAPCINENNPLKNVSTINSPDVISKSHWFFGDGTTSELLQPEKIYTTAGNFLVKLVSTSNNGCVSDTAVKTITVEDYPVAAFKKVINSCQGHPVQFFDSSYVSFGTINKWNWNLGDNATATSQNASHAYATANDYVVQLQVETKNGCTSDVLKKPLRVEDIPVAAFTNTIACFNKPIQFTNNSTIGFGNIASYEWDFGNGRRASTINPSHTYSNEGTFTASLITKSVNGCASLAFTRTFKVYPMNVSAGNDTVAAINMPIQLNATKGYHYVWTPGVYLNRDTIANPLATLSNDQLFNVTFTNDEGCVKYDDIKIKVYLGPDVYIPTAFTPNNDGRNDHLKVVPVGCTLQYFKIFNRWGQQLFSTANPSIGWDGTFNSAAQQADTYVWILSAKGATGKTIEKKGTIVLIR